MMILITGATGTVGSEVVKQLAAKGVKTRALVRNTNKATPLQQFHVELVQGDFTKPDTLDAALKNCERLFLLSPADPHQAKTEGAIIAAAKRAGLKHIVKLSAIGARLDSPINLAQQHAQAEKELQQCGIAYTILRPHFFMQNFFGHAPTIKKEGAFYAPMKEGKISMVDVRDIAAVAVAALTQDNHAGKIYEITGPEALSFADAAKQLSAAIGKTVTYVPVPPQAARNAMVSSGMPAWLADDLLKLFDVFSAGQAAQVSQVVAHVTKMKPHSFAQFAKDYAGQFKT